MSETGWTRTSPSAPWYLPEPPVMAPAYGAGSPRRISAWPVIWPPRNDVGGHALGLGARHRGDGADPSLVADFGVALEQLAGEHDLVTKGGSLEVLLGGDGVHA